MKTHYGHMRKSLFYYFLIACIGTYSARNKNSFASNPAGSVKEQKVSFKENKGQVHDQNYQPRPDILFSGTCDNLSYHLKNNGVSYQLYKVLERAKDKDPVNFGDARNKGLTADKIAIYRLDIEWLNTDPNALISTGAVLPGGDNYYLENCPDGVTHVRTFENITYKNIYAGVDLKWYQKDGKLKYDYIVKKGADYRQIKFLIKGAEKIVLSSKGELIMETPYGRIVEEAPLVKQEGRILRSRWKINNTTACFEIENIDPNKEFIIDPGVRVWGTYYGGTGGEGTYKVASDPSGNIYICGYTDSQSAIATSGSHQFIMGGGTLDAFLVKFNASGVRQWGTYYGGSNNDWGYNCAADPSGNVFLVGNTTSSSSTLIATSGCHQATFGGGTNTGDAFLVKFNSSGVRQWGTYYGDIGNDEGNGCATDASGNIYITGNSYQSSSAGTVIATSGAHQPTPIPGVQNGFLAKFNSSGTRLWATYYSGAGGNTWAYNCATDANGDAYLVGTASATTGISTPGSHQPSRASTYADAYLAKFNTAGVRLWGTYYGGVTTPSVTTSTSGVDCVTDISGNVFLAGNTSVPQGIATSGTHQTSLPGSISGFLVKFNPSGVRQWGTYYGGGGFNDRTNGCCVNNAGDVYLSGTTNASAGFATTGAHQTTFSGATDAYLVKFNTAGIRQWGTYYGGIGAESGSSCVADPSGNAYLYGMVGTSSATTAIVTPGAHQTIQAGSWDAFLVKFQDNSCAGPTTPVNVTPVGSQTACNGTPLALSATAGTEIIMWYSSPTSTTALSSGTTFNTPSLSPGIYTYYAATSNTCAEIRTPITVTVGSGPTITVNSGAVCSGSSFTIIPTGAASYSISGGNTVVSPFTNTSYSVIGFDPNGCPGPQAISSITVLAIPTLSVSTKKPSLCKGQSTTLTVNGASTYSWSTGGTASVVIVSPTLTTTYTVSGTSANSCKNSVVFTQSVTTCNTIAEAMEETLALVVFPNPGSGEFYLKTKPVYENMQADIYNSLGQLILRQEISSAETRLEMNHFAAGIYFVSIKYNNIEIGNTRLLIEK
jgi:hypothetical protein